MTSTDIKNQIKAELDELVPGTLGEVIMDDFQPNVSEKDVSKYPAAILATPSVNSERLTNRENERAYVFEIIIVSKGEDITSATDIETLMDALLDKFDGNSTLDGNAITMDPATIPTAPVPTVDRSLILFSVVLNVRASVSADC